MPPASSWTSPGVRPPCVEGAIEVVVVDPSSDAGAGFRTGLDGMAVEALVRHRSSWPFDEDVLHPPAPPVHGGWHTCAGRDFRERWAGEPAALVGVADLAPPADV